MTEDLRVALPTLKEMRDTAKVLSSHVQRTPVHRWRGRAIEERVAEGTQVSLKLELLQDTGTFKARGALNNALALDEGQRARGVTAVSAGNHAIAAAYAAKVVGASAKVVMIQGANAARVDAAQAFGAQVLFAPDGPTAFRMAEEIALDEGRAFLHPFEGKRTALATAGVGLEFMQQVEGLEAVLVAIGGGGLAAGVASAVKAERPECLVIGVEPVGSACMGKSLELGEPTTLDVIDSIADSLGAPMTLPYTFAACQAHLDEVVTVEDEALIDAMRVLFEGVKLAVEPACAATTAALMGPLRERLAGKHVGLILCGSNVDLATFSELVGGCGE